MKRRLREECVQPEGSNKEHEKRGARQKKEYKTGRGGSKRDTTEGEGGSGGQRKIKRGGSNRRDPSRKLGEFTQNHFSVEKLGEFTLCSLTVWWTAFALFIFPLLSAFFFYHPSPCFHLIFFIWNKKLMKCCQKCNEPFPQTWILVTFETYFSWFAALFGFKKCKPI